MTIKNNILWGNTASQGKQIFSSGGSITVTYNDIQGGYAGNGNINQDPGFDAFNYYLSGTSSCIDKGDSTAVYNDLPDAINPLNAQFPSKGGLRNDLGAYGGPYCSLLSSLNTIWTEGPATNQGPPAEILIMPNPVKDEADIVVHAGNENSLHIELFDINGHTVKDLSVNTSAQDQYRIRFSRGNLSSGIYWLVLTSGKQVLARKSLTLN